MQQTKLNRVVITGIGAISPLGLDVSIFWRNIKNGVSGASMIERFNTSNFKTKFACQVKGYDSAAFFNKRESRRIDRFAQFGVIASDEAIKDSGILEDDSINRSEVGVIFGSGIGGIITFQEEIKSFFVDNNPHNPLFIPKMIPDIAAGNISIKYGFMSANYAVVSACASSAHAIISSYDHIRLGRGKIVISGGSEASINESGIGGFNALHALSQRNDDIETASRPFDKGRDGFVMGEGGAALVLEEYEHAKKRGAKIYAEIVGTGASADAYHMTAPHPQGLGAIRVMEEALKESKLNVESIDHINMHGTSTPLGDKMEALAIQKVFKDHAYKMNLNSTKSMTGHLLGASGAIEVIVTALSLKEGIIPPTTNHFEKDDEIDSKLNFTFNTSQEKKLNYAMTNTFGFGGHNACLVLKKI